MRILVTGAGGASGMCTILALKKTDNVIFGCDCNKYSPGLYLAHEKFTVPMAKDENRFIEKIIIKVEEHSIDVIFPNVDEELLVFAKNKSDIPCNIIISPFSTIGICNDKSKIMSALKNIVPLPSMGNISPPFLIKPRIGRGSKNVYKVEDKNEMNALLNYLKFNGINDSDLIIQEYLLGKEYTVDALFDMKGNLVVAVPRQRVMIMSGASLVGITERNNQLISLVGKISKKLPFFGPVNFQFKEDKKGIPKLIEINPRCSGGMAITYRSGINLPKLALDILKGREISEEDLQWEEKMVFRYMTEVDIQHDKNSVFG
ncbi:MAG: ATP-grasp domain-containing protein [Candidatus Omnitrophica bacterium]|nr:ATP-grasp domain-containing protein [Candidatus Omnitrophota bacterium]